MLSVGELRRSVAAALAVPAVVLISIVAVAAPASAGTTMCSSPNYGFDCVAFTGYHGQPTWGYPVDGRGHNCTNYAAYRLAQNSAANPGNLGDAVNWDDSARTKGFLVDGNPVVGSIAQWNSNHVGYVEVVTPTYIETTDDSYLSTTARRKYFVGQSDWPDNFIHIADVSTPPAAHSSLAVSGSSGDVWSSRWPSVLAGQGFAGVAGDLAVSPNRLAVVDTNGNVYLKDLRSPTPTWNYLAGNVSKVAITDDRIAVLGTQGGVWAVDSGYALQQIAGGVRSIALSPTRFVVVGANDAAYVKVGSIVAAGWQRSVGGVASAAISDDRFAVVSPTGGVWANEGPDIGATMHFVHSGVQQVGLGTNRLAILGADSQVYVREGPITGTSWVSVAGGVSSISLAGQMIAVRNSAGGVWAGTSLTLINVANSTAGVATSSN